MHGDRGPDGETVRLIVPGDLDRVETLSRQVGFNQTAADWARLIRLEPDACFAIVRGDRIVATTTTTTYSPALAWVGMVVVDPAARRQGLGGRLVEHALQHLEAVRHVESVGLDATPEGRPLYERLGFAEQHRVHRLHGIATATDASACPGTRGMTEADLPRVADMDAATLGVARYPLLHDLFRAARGSCWVAEDAGRVVGWSFRRPGARRWHIGPVGAVEPRGADAAIAAAMAGIAGDDVVIDVIDGPQHSHVADRFGLSVARSFTRMLRGSPPPATDLSSCYATAAPELG